MEKIGKGIPLSGNDGTITLDQFNEWIKKNPHRTWKFPEGFREGATRDVKYFHLNLDTRDMRIFNISGRGLGSDFTVDFRDPGEDNLLDKLERKLDERLKRV